MSKDMKEIVEAFKTLQWAKLRFKFLVGNKIKSLVKSGKYKTIDACCCEISKAIEDATGTRTAEGTYRKHYELAVFFSKKHQDLLIKHNASAGFVMDLKGMSKEAFEGTMKNIETGKLTDLRPLRKPAKRNKTKHAEGEASRFEPITFEFPIDPEKWENQLASLLSRGQPVSIGIAESVLRRFK